jgi:predicted transcriptional regulator
MTNSINKEVVSPILEQGHGYLFHAAGANFKVTGSHIEQVAETNDVFNTLVAANRAFEITNEGISFLYDYNNKQVLSKVEEGAVKAFDNLNSLTEKETFLQGQAKELRLSGLKGPALTEVTKELVSTQAAIEEAKASSIAINFRYVKESNAFFAGNIEVTLGSEESLAERFFNIGYIKYQDKTILEMFQTAAKNFEAFKVLDFLTESKSGGITVLSMRAEKNVYVYRLNEDTKLAKFKKMLADAAIEFVAEETGVDVTEQFSDLLETASRVTEMRKEKIALYKEMLSFLFDQRGKLAEADRNLPDIKAADNLIETEIAKVQEDLNELEDKLDIEDGYVNASLKSEVDGLPEDAHIKVDAVEFNQAGKNDILTVFFEDRPFRVEKYKINISQEDNV